MKGFEKPGAVMAALIRDRIEHSTVDPEINAIREGMALDQEVAAMLDKAVGAEISNEEAADSEDQLGAVKLMEEKK